MGWRLVWMCAVAGLSLGCPETYGKDGSIDDAVHEDVQAQLEQGAPCPPKDEVKKLCENPQSERCPQQCR